MATSPSFNWPEPDNTDLVKNGALAIRTAVDAIDTSMTDLLGGTTGQVLTKASGTDMDFTWSAGASVPTSLGFAAGKNKVINGDFGIWQRGTSFSFGATVTFTADRFNGYGFSGTQTVSRQTFTPGTAPVAGYEGTYFLRTSCTNTQNLIEHKIEDVRTLAGQAVTLSFWAKSATATTVTAELNQNFGSGGSSTVQLTSALSVTTSWARYTFSTTLGSLSGKTIGTNSYLAIALVSTTLNNNLDIWGLQLEAGSTATDFQTATGTIQGELAACQRYYVRNTGSGSTPQVLVAGISVTSTLCNSWINLPVTMRTTPTSVEFGSLNVTDLVNYNLAVSNITVDTNTSTPAFFFGTITHASGAVVNRLAVIRGSSSSGYIGISAEL